MNPKEMADMINTIGSQNGFWPDKSAKVVGDSPHQIVRCEIPMHCAMLFEHVRARLYEISRKAIVEVQWTPTSPEQEWWALWMETSLGFVRYSIDQWCEKLKDKK